MQQMQFSFPRLVYIHDSPLFFYHEYLLLEMQKVVAAMAEGPEETPTVEMLALLEAALFLTQEETLTTLETQVGLQGR